MLGWADSLAGWLGKVETRLWGVVSTNEMIESTFSGEVKTLKMAPNSH